MKKFLEMDNDASFTLGLRFHMLFCKKCRHETEVLQTRFASLADGASYEMSLDLTDAIMAEVFASEAEYEHAISYFKWISVGLIIIFGRLLFTLSDTHIWLKNQFGLNFEIPLNIVLGLVITIYLALFVASHVDDIKEFMQFPFKWL